METININYLPLFGLVLLLVLIRTFFVNTQNPRVQYYVIDQPDTSESSMGCLLFLVLIVIGVFCFLMFEYLFS